VESYKKRTFPHEIGSVRGILSILDFAGGHAIAVVFDVFGVPVFMTPAHTCSADALNSCITTLTDPHGWARFRPGELLITGHAGRGFTAPCVLKLPNDWNRFMCEPAIESLEVVTSLVKTHSVTVSAESPSCAAFVAMELLVACVAVHARAFRHRWERIRV
jgi:hypothetical protein